MSLFLGGRWWVRVLYTLLIKYENIENIDLHVTYVGNMIVGGAFWQAAGNACLPQTFESPWSGWGLCFQQSPWPLVVLVLFTPGKRFWFKGGIFKSWIGKVYKILTHLWHQIALSKQWFDEVNRSAAAQAIWKAFSITAPHLNNKGEKFLARGVWDFNDP